jgi:cytochrome c biogenesis protein ResB
MLMRIDILDLSWRILGSRRFTLGVLVALMLVLACGAILPQRPQEAAIDSRQYAHWLSHLHIRYLQWADPLANWGFFSIRDSYWLEIPLALLIVNLVICGIDRFETTRRRHRPTLEDLASAFSEGSRARRFVAVEKIESTLARLRGLLESRRYRVHVQEIEGEGYVTALRFPIADWGSLFGHVGLILVIAGVLLGPRVAWQEPGIALIPNQEHQLLHAPSLGVRLESFQADFVPNGDSESYQAHLTVIERGSEVARGTASPGAPLLHGVMSIHQVSHGPLVTIGAADAEGSPIMLQALAQSGTPREEVSLQLSEDQSEGYVAIPERNLILRVVLQPQATAELQGSRSLLVQAYAEGTTEPVFSDTVQQSRLIQIEGDSYAIEWGHYAVLNLARDPTLVPIIVGAAALLAAITAVWVLRPRSVWVMVRGSDSLIEVRLLHPVDGDQSMRRRELDRLTAEIEEEFRGA